MANQFKIGHNFLTYTPVMSSVNSSYPASNLLLYNSITRHARSLVKTEVIIDIDMGSPTEIKGVMLNDVNFAGAYIEGSSDHSAWGYSDLLAISEDKTVKRSKIYASLTDFVYRYLRVRIPVQDPVARYPDAALSVFRMSSLVLCQDEVELMYNPMIGTFDATAPYPPPSENKFKDGGTEIIGHGDIKRAKLKFSFNPTTLDQLGELRDLDAILKPESNVVFYRNNGDTWECYLCKSRVSLETQEGDQTFATNTYEFVEN